MLVVPHQFAGSAYAILAPHLTWLGTWFTLAGGMLLGVAVLGASGRPAVVVQVLAGAALVALGIGAGTAGAWTSTVSYVVLGLGTTLAPLVARGREDARGDLF